MLTLLLLATAARAEVSLFVPAPPKKPVSRSESMALVARELSVNREQWLARLQAIKGVRVRTLKQGLDVSCFPDVEEKLKADGFTLLELKDMPIRNPQRRETMIEQFVDGLGGNLTRKVAVHVLPVCWVAVTPRADLKPGEARKNWIVTLQGLSTTGLGNVRAYLYRQFRRPAGFVCVEVDLSHGATLRELAAVFDATIGATLGNAMGPDGIDGFLERTGVRPNEKRTVTPVPSSR